MAERLKILLVEDSPEIRRAMTLLLQDAGYEVVAVGSVAEGATKLCGQSIALLDLFLPDGSGVDILQMIREQCFGMRVAFITAAYDLHIAESLMTPGDAIFRKPAPFEKILEWIDAGAVQ